MSVLCWEMMFCAGVCGGVGGRGGEGERGKLFPLVCLCVCVCVCVCVCMCVYVRGFLSARKSWWKLLGLGQSEKPH